MIAIEQGLDFDHTHIIHNSINKLNFFVVYFYKILTRNIKWQQNEQQNFLDHQLSLPSIQLGIMKSNLLKDLFLVRKLNCRQISILLLCQNILGH